MELIENKTKTMSSNITIVPVAKPYLLEYNNGLTITCYITTH